jgi:hypothetical protein
MIGYTVLNIIIGVSTGLVAGGAAYLFSKKRLPAAGVAILFFIVGFGLSRVALVEKYKVWSIQSEINQIPIMSAIKKYHSNDYLELMKEVKESAKSNDTSRNILVQSYLLANRLFLSDLKNASDDSIHEFLQALKNRYAFLYSKDPDLIFKLEYPDISVLFDVKFLKTDPKFKALQNAVSSAKRNIIQSSSEAPVRSPDPEVGAHLLNGIVNKLKAKYGEQAVNSAFNHATSTVPANVKADVILEFYQSLLDLKKSEAGAVMRYIGTLSDQKTKQ